jgi:GH24 family phage-related lysozyme (muramidase)
MAKGDTKERIKRIQSYLGVPADGVIGPTTLTALENALFDEKEREAAAEHLSLTVSKKGLQQIVRHEISSASYYRKFLSHPTWPGGASGVTIGIGYDLGYNNGQQTRKDWSGKLPEMDLERLVAVCGLKGDGARQVLKNVESVSIPLEAAQSVFYESTLSRYAAATARVYPGVEDLHPNAQAALLSLVYNRGTSLSGPSRREMAAIRDLVVQKDYVGISEQIRAMKRLWEEKGLDGLLKRRDDEARLVRDTGVTLDEAEIVRV